MPSIIELFKNKELLFPGGSTANGAVKKESETFIEQELSGIRIKSLVELNNPLIYGNEATRIVARSTPVLETMKQGTGGEQGDGGLIGKGLSKLGIDGGVAGLRDKVNDKLDIPKLLIPTEVVNKIIDSKANTTGEGSVNDSQTPITQKLYGKNGSDVGKFLKQTGGGNPTTIGKQALGKGIGVAKDKLRGALFGDPDSIGTAEGKRYAIEETTDQNTYSSTHISDRSVKDLAGFEALKNNKIGINLNAVSPIYGITRKESNRYKETRSLGFSKYDPTSKDKTYTGIEPYTKANGPKNQMFKDYKLGSSDRLNTISPADEYIMEDDAFMKVGEVTYKDFIPLWFKKIGATKPLVFRAIISGLTETSTPSWSSNKFIGNPYSFHMYDGIERSVSFNLKLMAASPVELNVIWERLKILTSYTYPTISAGLTTPPIITFRLGDMYVDREALLDSLTYTIPDESNWETDGAIGYLPKIIDVALSMKFIESVGAEDRLYDMQISKAAVLGINDKRTTDKEAIDLEAKTRGGVPSKETPIKEASTKRSSVSVLTGKGSSALSNAKSSAKGAVKSLKDKASDLKNKPSDMAAGITDPISGQSAVADKFDGNTAAIAAKELETKKQLTTEQSNTIINTKFFHKDLQVIPKSQIPSYYIQLGMSPDEPWPDSPGDVYIKYTINPDQTYAEVNYGTIDSTGFRMEMMTTQHLDDMIAKNPELANWKR